jgi:hypothetical protein
MISLTARSAMPSPPLLELQDRLVDGKSVTGPGMDLLDDTVALSAQHVLNFHRLHDRQLHAGHDAVAERLYRLRREASDPT